MVNIKGLKLGTSMTDDAAESVDAVCRDHARPDETSQVQVRVVHRVGERRGAQTCEVVVRGRRCRDDGHRGTECPARPIGTLRTHERLECPELGFGEGQGAVLTDPAAVAARAVGIAVDHRVKAIDGTEVEVRARSICIHGDTPGAVEMARAVRAGLEVASVGIHSFVI